MNRDSVVIDNGELGETYSESIAAKYYYVVIDGVVESF
jgi:hypothetical protein